MAMVEQEDPTYVIGNPIVPLEEPFIDDRGVIQGLLEITTRSLAIMTSVKGSIRANHWHATDWHYCYLISGELIYSERNVGSNEKPIRTTIKAGQLFFSPPNVEHAMYFTQDSQFLTISRNPRDHETYEDDVKRVPLVKAEDFADLP